MRHLIHLRPSTLLGASADSQAKPDPSLSGAPPRKALRFYAAPPQEPTVGRSPRSFISAVGRHPLIAERPLVKQFLKFGLVGALNTFIDYALFSIFTSLLGIHYLLANILSFSIAVTSSFILNRRWTFQSRHHGWAGEAAKYLTVYVIGLGLSELILYVFVDRFQLHQLVAKALAIAIVIGWNYGGTRFWTFRHPPAGLPG